MKSINLIPILGSVFGVKMKRLPKKVKIYFQKQLSLHVED